MNGHINNGRKKFVDRVCKKEALKIKGRSEKEYSTLAWIGMLGIIGWSVTIPMLIGVAIGAWIDKTFPGRYSFTIMLLFGGLAAGCLNAWNWVKKHYKQGNGNNDGEKKGPEDGHDKMDKSA